MDWSELTKLALSSLLGGVLVLLGNVSTFLIQRRLENRRLLIGKLESLINTCLRARDDMADRSIDLHTGTQRDSKGFPYLEIRTLAQIYLPSMMERVDQLRVSAEDLYSIYNEGWHGTKRDDYTEQVTKLSLSTLEILSAIETAAINEIRRRVQS